MLFVKYSSPRYGLTIAQIAKGLRGVRALKGNGPTRVINVDEIGTNQSTIASGYLLDPRKT